MRSAVIPPQSAHCVRSQLPQGDANPLSHRCAMPAPPKGELFEVAGKFLVTSDTLVNELTTCALSVIATRCHLSQRERQEHCRKLPLCI